jgi:hypothetical protein
MGGTMTSTLTDLRKLNPHVKVIPVEDPSFCHFGRLLTGAPIDLVSAYAREHAIPGDSVVYEPSVSGLEADVSFLAWLTFQIYGGMPVQLGWCYGRNQNMDALEYHKGNEVIVAVTDITVLVGHYDDIQWQPRPTYDCARVKAFFVRQGSVVEFYSWCLHYAPLHVNSKTGFCTLVALPHGTNLPFEHPPFKTGEASLLYARNKWLIVHPDKTELVKEGAHAGLKGENIHITGMEPA